MVISWERGKQPATRSGLGNNFQSPKKSRSSSYRSSRIAWNVLNPMAEKKRLFEQMLKMYTNPRAKDAVHTTTDSIQASTAPTMATRDGVVDKIETLEEDNWEDIDDDIESREKSANSSAKGSGRRITPDEAEKSLHANWTALLPTLTEDILAYTSASAGLPVRLADAILESQCQKTNTACQAKSTQVLCLYLDHFKSISVKSCQCKSIAQILVRNGLFPTSPCQARMAISIDLLDFYAALFERSCDAVNAMAAAVNSFYTRRGFYLLDSQGRKFKEPFRKGLGYASQWLDKLRNVISKHVDDALHIADQWAQKQKAEKTGLPATDQQAKNPETESDGVHGPHPSCTSPLTECSRSLRLLCPACFGSASFGKSLLDGGDFHICTDGNFHHRHLVSGGSGMAFHDAKHFIPKAFVDQVGQIIESARRRPKRVRKPRVPDDAIDECENSYQAANGDKKKAVSGNERYDDYGYMSLVCRHDIPIFFANIDTPGEQQKYAIALIWWFFQFVPPNATATILYDVACVLERSNQLFGFLPEGITSRIQFVTTAMHAYGHQWACQLVYNPRLCRGLGLTDGEGTERMWSRLIKLIPIVRASSAARRLWLTDRQLNFIASDSRDDLGDWIKRRFGATNVQQQKAEEAFSEAKKPLAEIQAQWEMQKLAQLSHNPFANNKKSRELDAILGLQGQWDGIDHAIQAAKNTFQLTRPSGKYVKTLSTLQDLHEQQSGDLENLYSSLSSGEPLPKVKGTNPEFWKALLLARDLKINIRRRAIGSFFEWDRLDQAVGGRNMALGTKLHQQTRKAIARRQPALMSAIRKYNACCTTLERLYNPACNLPLPQPLPTKLAELRNNSALMEDVMTTSCGKPPLWLEDAGVRSGIRAMLKRDRCLEERKRLEAEAENLCCWLGREFLAVELALCNSLNAGIITQLTQHRDHLLQLKFRWVSPFIPLSRFEFQVVEAQRIASELANGPAPIRINKQYFLNGSIFIDHEVTSKNTEEAEGVDELNHNVGPEMLLVSDILEGTEVHADDFWPEDTSTIQNGEMITLIWEKPPGLLDDNFALTTEMLPAPSGPLTKPRALGSCFFDNQDLQRLSSARTMLNDTCLNGCAQVLKSIFDMDPTWASRSSRCALFSTHDLVRARYKARDKELWRAMSPTQYWEKDIWILPIHRPRQLHWVLCVAYPRYRTVLLYDSLASQQFWPQDLQDISNLFTRLVKLANQFGHKFEMPLSSWVAHPAITIPVQSNSYDCGLWVLAWMVSALRGFGTCGAYLTEQTMPQWRSFLTALIAGLPLHKTC